MDISIDIKIRQFKADDFSRLGEVENELKVRRWNRFIRYCHTGRFD